MYAKMSTQQYEFLSCRLLITALLIALYIISSNFIDLGGWEIEYVFFSDQFADVLLWSVLGTNSINRFNGLIRKSQPSMTLYMNFVMYYKTQVPSWCFSNYTLC